jgi:hypothetical protein
MYFFKNHLTDCVYRQRYSGKLTVPICIIQHSDPEQPVPQPPQASPILSPCTNASTLAKAMSISALRFKPALTFNATATANTAKPTNEKKILFILIF